MSWQGVKSIGYSSIASPRMTRLVLSPSPYIPHSLLPSPKPLADIEWMSMPTETPTPTQQLNEPPDDNCIEQEQTSIDWNIPALQDGEAGLTGVSASSGKCFLITVLSCSGAATAEDTDLTYN